MQTGLTQDKTINKLIMLFVFDKMETAMTESTILDLCFTKNNWISFANCKETLLDIVNSGFVYKTQPMGKDIEVLYDLTTEGRVCLANFYTRIPSSIRKLISEHINLKRREYRRRQDYVANYEKCPDGSYNVTLRIDEATKTALEINLNVTTRSTAKQIEKAWQEKAPLVYSKLEELLID